MTPQLNTTELSVEPTSYVTREKWGSRIMAALLLIPAGPVIGALALLVRLTSRGAAFYTQERSGLGGKPFMIYKIRTMQRNAEVPGQPVWSTPGDSRVTLIGRVLRFLHLDELPQLLNIARGEMAFIGPRPERPQIVEELADTIPGYVQRLQVLPGVTGLAQINLNPDETVECVRKKLVLDCLYISTASRPFDIRILVCTALRMIGIRHGIAAKLMNVRFRFDDDGSLYHGNQLIQSPLSSRPAMPKRAKRRRSAPLLVRAGFNDSSDRDHISDDSSPSMQEFGAEALAHLTSVRPATAGAVVRPK